MGLLMAAVSLVVPLPVAPKVVTLTRAPLTETATEAEADLVASAALVAVTVTVVLVLTAGAVKSPELEIVPAVADHVTAVLVEPVTVAVNCWVPAEATEALVGDAETATGALTVTVADADLLVSARLVAVTE